MAAPQPRPGVPNSFRLRCRRPANAAIAKFIATWQDASRSAYCIRSGLLSPDSVGRVHALWDALSDFHVGRSVEAVDHLMACLVDLGGLSHATWAGAIRMSHEPDDDPLLGWRVARMRALQPAPAPAGDSHFRDLLRIWDRREIDPSFLLPLRNLGAFRTYSLRRDLPPAWFDTSFYKTHYGRRGFATPPLSPFP